jgi:dihydrofolate synthase / folylpolyglutamate synthase
MDFASALAYLEQHINLEADTSARAAGLRLAGIRQLVGLMADPQAAYPVIHITGTNGKGSTARMLTAMLAAKGLSVGTYTSPHLQRINERMAWNGEPMSDAAFAECIEAVALTEPLLDAPPTHFEILTAAAFRWFADVGVDVAVVEVGLGGRFDATNVADADVAVVTNVALEHVEVIGPTRRDIATEKAGIVKPGRTTTLVLGETDPELTPVFAGAGAAATWQRDRDFGCVDNRLAHRGRLLTLRTPTGEYPDLFLPLHGWHQGDNAAAALAAAEAFFGDPLAPELVEEALAAVVVPGRMEVVDRRPLVLLDGAHNLAGARALATALAEEFPVGPEPSGAGRILVVGMVAGKDPAEMLAALDARQARLVVACTPPSPRAQPAEAIAAAANDMGIEAEVGGPVPRALARALALAEPDEQVIVTGSLYVVGAARSALSTGVG